VARVTSRLSSHQEEWFGTGEVGVIDIRAGNLEVKLIRRQVDAKRLEDSRPPRFGGMVGGLTGKLWRGTEPHASFRKPRFTPASGVWSERDRYHRPFAIIEILYGSSSIIITLHPPVVELRIGDSGRGEIRGTDRKEKGGLCETESSTW